jgi:hypothetical protein
MMLPSVHEVPLPVKDSDPGDSVSEVNPTVPAWFDVLLCHLLEADRERRPRDIQEVISACANGTKAARAPKSELNRPWSPLLIGGLGVVLFGLLWTAPMAALNWWRLGSPSKAWRPVVIALTGYLLGVLFFALLDPPLGPTLVNLLTPAPALLLALPTPTFSLSGGSTGRTAPRGAAPADGASL